MPHTLTVSVPDAAFAEALGPVPEDVELVIWDASGAAPREHIDLIVAPYVGFELPLSTVAALTPQLVQIQSIGFDRLEESTPRGVRVANAATVHEASTAEIALLLALGLLRNIVKNVHDQAAHTWDQRWAPGLADRRALILGAGGVGNAIADRLIPFEVDVRRAARTARRDERGEIHSLEAVADLLPETDLVFIALPLTRETRHLVNAEFLAGLPDGAAVINVGRGAVVDTNALLDELLPGRLLAGLDVVDPEPLPTDHPLWDAPGTLITPHVGGLTGAMRPRIIALVRRQIDALRSGKRPENIVIEA